MQDRGTEAIYLCPTGNHQGTCKFLRLKTWKVIKRRKFDELPTPDSVIQKVDARGRRDQSNGRLVFRDRNNNPYDWEEEHDALIEDNVIEQEPEPAPYPDIPAEFPGVQLERDQPAVTPDAEPTEEELADAAARNADFGPIEEALMREAFKQGNDDRVIEIDLNVVPAEEGEIEDTLEEQVSSAEEETSNEDYDPGEDEEDDNESLKSLLNPADDDDYESSDDEGEEDEAPRRSGRAQRNVVR